MAHDLRNAGLVLFVLTIAVRACADDGAQTDSYDDRSRIYGVASASYDVTAGTLRLAFTTGTPARSFGDGVDGPCVVAAGTVDLSVASCSGRATADAAITVLSTSATEGDTTLTLAATTG